MQPEAIIGRDRPARVLREHVERTVTSHGGLVLVAGEAGIGKSTLVADAAAHAARAGAMVLTGACWDGPGAPGLWPWVQVVRALRRTAPLDPAAPPQTWTAGAEAAGPLLPVLLGEPGATAEHNTFAVFDAATTLLVTAARQRPVVVVIEDLHWADPASLRLLEFTARHTWFERLLVIGTYRDDEIDAPVATTSVTLTGLDPAGVAALIARTTGSAPTDELVAEIHRRTGGNPFFVEQTARLWQGGGVITTVPAGVGAVLRRRLARLPDALVDLLGTAALLGHEFAAPLLGAATGGPAPQVAALLGQAVTARLIVPLDGDRYRFAHDIVRETLTVPDPAQRHAAVVRAITAGAAHLSITERARHAYLGAAALPAGVAVDHILLAARDAAARLVPEEAAGHRRRALELLDDDPPRRATVLLDLAAELVLAGQDVEGRQMVDEAVTIGRALGDPGLLARIALDVQSLGIEGPWVEAIQEAHRAVVGTVAAPAAMAGSAGPLDGAAQQLSVHAAQRARDADDDTALAHSLMSRIGAIWGLGTAAERVAITGELAAVAARTADPGLELEALSWRIGALVELGDSDYLAAHRTFAAKTERSGLARFRHEAAGSEAMVATLTGRFDDARAALDAIVDHGDHGDRPGIGGAETLQVLRWAVALLQGRFDEVDALLEAMQAAGQRGIELMRATSAVQRGDADHARRHLAEVIASGTEHLRWVAPLWLRFQAQAAALAGDPQLCATARAALVPFADQWALTATLVVDGPVVHWIAVLDAALGRWDDAVAGFTAAHGTAERMGARPWSVLARRGLAAALRSRAVPGDAERAEALDAAAERDAAGLGMRIGTAAERDTFRRDGAVWTLTFAGRTARLPDAKGLRDLHVLLGVPGEPVPAVRLLDPAAGAVAVAVGSSGGDPVLDATALAAYRRRLTELDAALDSGPQPARAAALERERQALLDELKAATGLGGRSRRLGDGAERARKAVTNRIRDALRRIGEAHPELAAHLRATVSTGTTCAYTPPYPRSWRR